MADGRHLEDLQIATSQERILVASAHWRLMANTIEPVVCDLLDSERYCNT